MGSSNSRCRRCVSGGDDATSELVLGLRSGELGSETWTGHWKLGKRCENWGQYLAFLGVPPEVRDLATKAPDFHEYVVTKDTFFMDHQIPAQKLHLRFTGFLDGEWQKCPYPRPTGLNFDEAKAPEHSGDWKHEWVKEGLCFLTTIPDFAGKGKTVTLRRELKGPDEILYTVHVYDADGSVSVGPCYTHYERVNCEPPQSPVQELREIFLTGVTRPIEWRMNAIDQCGKLLRENVGAISAAMEADHIRPSDFNGALRMCEGAIMFYKGNLKTWMATTKPEETLPPQMRSPGEWSVTPEPKGVGLVIAPWNAPILLCVLPLMGMFAAGNCCVLKPSELAPHSARLLARLIPRYFPKREVVVQEGGPQEVQALIAAKCDHIVFTGGGAVATKICEQAAQTLTPVSLELGGKNPCFIDKCAKDDLESYVAEIVGTKRYFGGMFCQCHDYCLVHEKAWDDVCALIEKYIDAQPGAIRLINARHAERVKALLKGHEQQCLPKLGLALGVRGHGPVAPDEAPLCAVLEPALDSALMQEEIFGPLLPLVKVKDAQEAAAFVRSRPAPLVCYCYSPDKASQEQFETVACGNLAINCGPMKMQSNMNVGFGGVGASGHGYSIWGKAAFDDYSHKKPSFRTQGFAGSIWAPKAGAAGQGMKVPA